MAVAQEMMLSEEEFETFFNDRRDVVDTFFRPGYLFNPCLFGTFMDPSKPFPLWDYTPFDLWPTDTVSLSKSRVDWSQTEDSILLCADLPGMKKEDIEVTIEEGRVLKINGHWNSGQDDTGYDSSEWWKQEFMRKFLLPENASVEHAHARMDDGVLEIRIPKAKHHKSSKSHDRKKQIPAVFTIKVTD